MAGGEIIGRESGADNDHRVDGEPSTLRALTHKA
jgi:hypothetical protein